MDNNNNKEKLVRYIDDELSEAEAQVLMIELEGNDSLQQELNNLLLTRGAIKNYGLTQKVKGIHETMMQELPNAQLQTKAVVRSLSKSLISIAATIILLVGLFGLYEYLSVSAGKLYEEKYFPYQIATMRSSTAPTVIESNYIEKKEDNVIAEFEKLPQPTINDEFLTAQAYLQKADYNNAIKLFNTIIQKNKASNAAGLNEAASYYLALSYLSNKQTDKALLILEEIYNDKTHLYHNKVDRWYLFKVQLLNWKH